MRQNLVDVDAVSVGRRWTRCPSITGKPSVDYSGKEKGHAKMTPNGAEKEKGQVAV
jgi:hypothetical protein